MRVIIILLLSVWLLASVLYIVRPKWLWKFRMTLHRLGWLNKWSMFIRNETDKNARAMLSYRDKGKNEKLGEWQLVPRNGKHPFRFLLNLELRMYYAILSCVKELVKRKKKGEENLDQNDYFLYLVEIMNSYPPNKLAIARQIRLVYWDDLQEGEQMVAETEFIAVK